MLAEWAAGWKFVQGGIKLGKSAFESVRPIVPIALKCFGGPFRHLDIRPIPELSAIPAHGTPTPSGMRLALRITNPKPEEFFISAIQAEAPMPPDGRTGIPQIGVWNPNGAAIVFPLLVRANSSQDVLVDCPIRDNSAQYINVVLRLYALDSKNGPDLRSKPSAITKKFKFLSDGWAKT